MKWGIWTGILRYIKRLEYDREWMEGVPPKIRYNRSNSVWFDMVLFEDCFTITQPPKNARWIEGEVGSVHQFEDLEQSK